MSIHSSYISDVYSTYAFEPDCAPSHDLSPLLSHLCHIANSREGEVPKTVLDREFIISWLKNNIDHHLLEEKGNIIGSLFDFDKKSGIYTIKAAFKKETPLLKNAVKTAVDNALSSGVNGLMDCYLAVCTVCEQYGVMELAEFKKYLEGYAIKNGKILGYTQLTIV